MKRKVGVKILITYKRSSSIINNIWNNKNYFIKPESSSVNTIFKDDQIDYIPYVFVFDMFMR